MPTLTSYYSLVEQAKRINPDGELAIIAEVLNRKMGDILQEAPWLASNDTWVNKTVRRAALPSSARRKLNQGVAKGVARTTEIMDVMEMREVYAEYDKAYIDSFPDPARMRLQEAKAFLEGLGQDLCSDILYCDSNEDPDGMHGFEPRLHTIDDEFVINCSGSGNDTTSIYVVTWGENEVYLTYPKNIPNMGIEHRDLGEQTITDVTTTIASSSQFQGYRDWFGVKVGLVVKNPRCLGRVANIETSGSTNTFDEDKLIQLLENMDIGPSTRIYCNQTITTQARIKLKDKTNVHWAPQQGLGGLPFLTFDEIPVKKIDKSILLNTEETIS